MSEDDTFRKLRQTPFAELVILSEATLDERWAIQTIEDRNASYDKFLHEHGWTYKEFCKEMYGT